MTYKSKQTRVTEFFSPVAKVAKTAGAVVKLAAKGVRAVARDPLGIKRTKKLMEMHDREMEDKMRTRKAAMKKEYYNMPK